MHLKREKAPKRWTIPRKGNTYVVRTRLKMDESMPVLIALRDLLKIAENRKEVKKAIREKNILLNKKPVTEDRQGLVLFDVLTIVPQKKEYKLVLKENKKFDLEEISGKEAGSKIAKVINKKILKGKKIQLNLSDGRNVISDEKCKINDSVSMDFVSKKVLKCIPLTEKANAVVFEGKHAGGKGVIDKIDWDKKTVEITGKNGKINALIKQVMAVN
jgi:small subunit ribosomal protein S4e